jgi:hypothetical protein
MWRLSVQAPVALGQPCAQLRQVPFRHSRYLTICSSISASIVSKPRPSSSRDYRAYILDERGHIIPLRELEASGDGEALSEAQKLVRA